MHTSYIVVCIVVRTYGCIYGHKVSNNQITLFVCFCLIINTQRSRWVLSDKVGAVRQRSRWVLSDKVGTVRQGGYCQTMWVLSDKVGAVRQRSRWVMSDNAQGGCCQNSHMPNNHLQFSYTELVGTL